MTEEQIDVLIEYVRAVAEYCVERRASDGEGAGYERMMMETAEIALRRLLRAAPHVGARQDE